MITNILKIGWYNTEMVYYRVQTTIVTSGSGKVLNYKQVASIVTNRDLKNIKLMEIGVMAGDCADNIVICDYKL